MGMGALLFFFLSKEVYSIGSGFFLGGGQKFQSLPIQMP